MMDKEKLEEIEEWKDIREYEGLYKVSDLGGIKSLSRRVKSNRGYRLKKEKVLKQTKNNRGYKTIYLCKDGECKQFYVHRIVATSFVRNPNPEEVVNHIDGVKTNNHYSNLEWCTSKRNNEHAVEKGLWNNHGVGHRLSKFTKDDVMSIRKEKKLGKTNKEISETYGVHETTIGKLLRGETYKHY